MKAALLESVPPADARFLFLTSAARAF